MLISPTYAQETSAEVTLPDDAAAPYELSQEKMLIDTLTFLFLLFIIFYFMLIRPQQKKIKAHQEMSKGLKRGDKVITNGGLVGTVNKLEGDHLVVLELTKGVEVKVIRGSISSLYTEPKAEPKTPKPANDK